LKTAISWLVAYLDEVRRIRVATSAVKHGQSAMIQIRQGKHSATVVRLDSLFAQSDGLPCRRIELWQIVRAVQHGERGLEHRSLHNDCYNTDHFQSEYHLPWVPD
jgi:hypothetical protein